MLGQTDNQRNLSGRLYWVVSGVLLFILLLGVALQFIPKGFADFGADRLLSPVSALIDKDANDFRLQAYIEYFEDTSKTLSFREVVELHADEFQRYAVEDKIRNFGYTDSGVWLRVSLLNRAKEDVIYYLLEENPLVGTIDIYQAGQSDRLAYSGFLVPLDERAIRSNQSVFKLEFSPVEKKELYIRIASDFPLSAPFSIYSEDNYFHYQNVLRMIEGIIFGTTLALLIYNLFLWYLERQVLYFYMAFYIVAITCTSLSNTGYYIYLFPDCDTCGGNMNFISGALVIAAVCPQVNYYLGLRERMPKWFQVLRVTGFFGLLVCFPLALFGSRDVYLISIIPPTLILLVGIIVTAGSLALKRYRPAIIFLAATIAPILSAVVWVFYVAGLIPPIPFLLTYQPMATAIQLIVLSFGVADRINELREQTVQVEKNIYRIHEQSKIKSEFLAQMSHEIRTPINGILGMISVFREENLNNYQHFFADIIYRSGRQLLATINNVLDYSKLDAGKMELDLVEFDIDEKVCDTLTLFTPIVENSLLEISYTLSESVPRTVVSDPTKFAQIIFNLVDNAIKYSTFGKIVVALDTASTGDNETALLLIRVQDQGVGFDRYSELLKVSNIDSFIAATNTGSEHTGLGLNVVGQYIKLLGGTINMESYPGEGTAFKICLPIGRLRIEDDSHLYPFESNYIVWLGGHDVFYERAESLARYWGVRFFCVPEENVESAEVEEAGRQAIIFCRKDTLERNQTIIKKRWSSSLIVTFTSQSSNLHVEGEKSIEDLEVDYLTSRDKMAAEILRLLGGDSSLANTAGHNEPIEMSSVIGGEILVAEDNAVNQLIIKRMLSSLKCQFSIFDNGRELVNYYMDSYDTVGAILMDCEMPILDGFSASKEIRAFEKGKGCPEVRIIALTAHLGDEISREIEDAGMDDAISKPVDKNILVDTLVGPMFIKPR